MTFLPLSFWDLALAALLLLMNGAIAIALRLGLARQLFVAALRMVVQLALVALVLRTLFESVSGWLTLAVALLMVLFAGREAMARQQRRLAGWWGYGLGTTAMLFAGSLMTLFALLAAIEPEPWYQPRFAIPLLGMILGNCMTGVALGLDRLLSRAQADRAGVEAMLALGYGRRQALRPLVADAVRAGLIPIVNAMAATGLVSLPGMMTGQILAGIAPEEAVKYQLLIMFLIAGGTALGVLLAVTAASFRLSDERHRLRLDRLTAPRA